MKKCSERRLLTDVNVSELRVNLDQPINKYPSACYIEDINFCTNICYNVVDDEQPSNMDCDNIKRGL